MVSLEFYQNQERYLAQLKEISLTDEDRYYTQTPAEVFITLEDPNRRMVLILNDGECVGYFVLHEKDGALDIGFDDKALLVRALAISPTHQGKGLAFAGMAMLAEFVRANYSHVDKMVLIVNEKNVPAQKLYQKVGFAEHGSRLHETHGTQLIWRYDL